jgi:hypothetical protein
MGRLILVGGSGLMLSLVVLLLARRGRLSMRYTMGWFFVAAALVVGGVFGELVDKVASALEVEPVTVMLTAVLVGSVSLAVQLSISVSGLAERVRTLAESHALLEARLRAIEPAPMEAASTEVEGFEANRDER